MNTPDSVIYMGMALAVYFVVDMLALFYKLLW
jgi:hypothetical protein